MWVVAAVVSALYLLNPGFGLFEFFPDNVPFIGNIDEGFMAFLLLRSLIELKLIKDENVKKLLSLKR